VCAGLCGRVCADWGWLPEDCWLAEDCLLEAADCWRAGRAARGRRKWAPLALGCQISGSSYARCLGAKRARQVGAKLLKSAPERESKMNGAPLAGPRAARWPIWRPADSLRPVSTERLSASSANGNMYLIGCVGANWVSLVAETGPNWPKTVLNSPRLAQDWPQGALQALAALAALQAARQPKAERAQPSGTSARLSSGQISRCSWGQISAWAAILFAFIRAAEERRSAAGEQLALVSSCEKAACREEGCSEQAADLSKLLRRPKAPKLKNVRKQEAQTRPSSITFSLIYFAARPPPKTPPRISACATSSCTQSSPHTVFPTHSLASQDIESGLLSLSSSPVLPVSPAGRPHDAHSPPSAIISSARPTRAHPQPRRTLASANLSLFDQRTKHERPNGEDAGHFRLGNSLPVWAPVSLSPPAQLFARSPLQCERRS